MRTNYYTDEFEDFLKNTTDSFRMYPSEKVWHSLYNNLHPGRKWPSLPVLLLFICSLLFLGILNTKQYIQSNIISPKGPTTLPSLPLPAQTSLAKYIIQPALNEDLSNVDRIKSKHLSNYFTFQNTSTYPLVTNNDSKFSFANINMFEDYNDFFFPPQLNNLNNTDILNEGVKDEKNTPIPNLIAKINTTENNENEDYGFHNLPSSNKLRTGFSYQLYATPSFGYRSLKKSSFNSSEPSFTNTISGQQSLNNSINQDAAFNMEMGGNVLMNITKLIRLTAGMQLNYTNYNIKTFQLNNPSVSSLFLTDLYNGINVSRPSSPNLPDNSEILPKTLSNNTYQVSLPLGADIKIAERNNIKWFAGATVQPTYIIKGNSYLISSDLKSYTENKSLIRKGNLNGGIETFISYKTPNGLILNAGPQFRYQFFSTYTRQYNYDEKLYNLGIKLGVSKSF